VTNDLRVRSKPGVSDDSKKLEPLAQDGDLFVVVDGPVQASGYDWYLVQPYLGFEMETEPPPFGWVAAAGTDGEPWIEPESIDCPPVPQDAEDIALLNETDQMFYELTCFDGLELTFRARMGWFEADCEFLSWWAADPPWFDPCSNTNAMLVAEDASREDPALVPAWGPDADTSMAGDPLAPPEHWPLVEVTGQFDHPSALTCRTRMEGAEPEMSRPDPLQTIVDCRRQFVVTSVREVDG
jgi:hypothetical protein